jgi:hypothetical protein
VVVEDGRAKDFCSSEVLQWLVDLEEEEIGDGDGASASAGKEMA